MNVRSGARVVALVTAAICLFLGGLILVGASLYWLWVLSQVTTPDRGWQVATVVESILGVSWGAFGIWASMWVVIRPLGRPGSGGQAGAVDSAPSFLVFEF